MSEPDSAGVRLRPPADSRVAVVGGCGGIGRAFVAAAVKLRLEVAVLDLPRSFEQHPPPAGVLGVPCDATDERSVRDAFAAVRARWPALDGVVNLVGFTSVPTRVAEMPAELWDEITAGCLRSAFLVSRAAIPLLRGSARASLVHTASTFGVAVRFPGYGPYAAAKAGVVNLVRALAVECGPEIRVNGLAPGLTDTEFLRGGTGRPEREQSMDTDTVGAALPLRRVAQPADMVGPLLFLLGPGSAYMTAQTLHVNGGLWS